ncbi:MAG: hypothetical protein KTR28_00115 [Micavibrio sp.]|nr:hypothetical protein [Micavibrio sp.]
MKNMVGQNNSADMDNTQIETLKVVYNDLQRQLVRSKRLSESCLATTALSCVVMFGGLSLKDSFREQALPSDNYITEYVQQKEVSQSKMRLLSNGLAGGALVMSLAGFFGRRAAERSIAGTTEMKNYIGNKTTPAMHME